MSPEYFSSPGTFSPRLGADARPLPLDGLEASGWGWGGSRGVTRLLPIYSSASGNTASFSLQCSSACVCNRSKRVTISCPLSLALATPSLAPYSSHPFYTPLIPITVLQHAPGFKRQLTREPLRHTLFHSIRVRFSYMGSTRCQEPAGLQAHQVGGAQGKRSLRRLLCYRQEGKGAGRGEH